MADKGQNHNMPVGFPIDNWQIRPVPPRSVMQGSDCRLEPFNPTAHSEALYQAYGMDTADKGWNYLPYGPFTNRDDFNNWLDNYCMGDDPFFHAIVDNITNHACGLASYLRIQPASGCY